jgi:ribose/xylose/arabinose/galactoside ABC-type transport system permease subunit
MAKKAVRSKSIPLIVVIAAVIIVFFLINSNYLSLDNIKGIMVAMSLSGTIAVGMGCLLIGGGVDLAAGAEGLFGGILVAFLLKYGVPWPLALIMTVVAGAACGAVNALLVNGLNFMGFIATIATSSILRGISLVVTANQNVPISNQGYWNLGTYAVFGVIPMPFIIMLILISVYGFILSSTQFGRNMYLVGGNRWAARLSGLNPKKIQNILYINCGAIAALSGAVVSARMHSGSPSAVIGSEMDAITAAVLGGISFMGGSGGMGGCLIGLILLNCFNNGLTVANVQPYWQVISQGVLLIIALIVDYFNERSRIKALKARASD